MCAVLPLMNFAYIASPFLSFIGARQFKVDLLEIKIDVRCMRCLRLYEKKPFFSFSNRSIVSLEITRRFGLP